MKAAVLVFPGSNCDRDLAVAFRAAGFEVDMVCHKEADLPAGTDIVGVPGGFSYGDALGAGRLWASDLRWLFQDELARFVGAGKPVMGICNGFQVLLKSGVLLDES